MNDAAVGNERKMLVHVAAERAVDELHAAAAAEDRPMELNHGFDVPDIALVFKQTGFAAVASERNAAALGGKIVADRNNEAVDVLT